LVDRDSLARQLSALSMSHQHDITNQNAAHARLSADLKEAESRADALQLELFKRQNEVCSLSSNLLNHNMN
jgi:hypothetical protein